MVSGADQIRRLLCGVRSAEDFNEQFGGKSLSLSNLRG
jgi:hypothetical protein